MALVFEGGAWYFALREFTRAKGKWGYLEAVAKGKDPSLFIVLFEDSAAMLGIVVAFTGIYLAHATGNPFYDGAASVIIGIILACTAAWLAYETKGLLIGEAANKEVVDGIRAIAAESPAVSRVNEVLTMHVGPEFILATLSVTFDDDAKADDIERTCEVLDVGIKERFPRVKRVFIEAEDWTPRRH